MDIGCYLVQTARWIFGREPERVVALAEVDPRYGVDRLTSLMLDFGRGGGSDPVSSGAGHAIGTCSTQQTPYQRIQILGARGRIEVEIPFNAPSDRPCRFFVGDGSDPTGVRGEAVDVEVCDQYTLEVDRFADVVLDGRDPPLPIEDSVRNMRVIDALVRSAASGRWERP
jgi:predicted dehydrogenase